MSSRHSLQRPSLRGARSERWAGQDRLPAETPSCSALPLGSRSGLLRPKVLDNRVHQLPGNRVVVQPVVLSAGERAWHLKAFIPELDGIEPRCFGCPRGNRVVQFVNAVSAPRVAGREQNDANCTLGERPRDLFEPLLSWPDRFPSRGVSPIPPEGMPCRTDAQYPSNSRPRRAVQRRFGHQSRLRATSARRLPKIYTVIIWAAGSRRRRSPGSLVTMRSCRSLAIITTDASITSEAPAAPQSSPQERASCSSRGTISTSSLRNNRAKVT